VFPRAFQWRCWGLISHLQNNTQHSTDSGGLDRVQPVSDPLATPPVIRSAPLPVPLLRRAVLVGRNEHGLPMPAASLPGNASKVGVATIRRVEVIDGEISATTANRDALRRPLEAAGVEFIDENGGGAGVRLRRPGSGRPDKKWSSFDATKIPGARPLGPHEVELPPKCPQFFVRQDQYRTARGATPFCQNEANLKIGGSPRVSAAVRMP
jgi:hypothetical protein